MDELINFGGIKFGNFKLKSGKTSTYYVDLRNTYSHHSIFSKIINEFNNAMQDLVFKNINYEHKRLHVLGIPYGAIPYASVLAYNTKSSLLVIRKEPKAHGLGNMIEGDYEKGDNIVIIEDVITSGQSIKQNIDTITEQGLVVSDIFVILDREEGGMKYIENMGYRINALYKISDIIPKCDISTQLICIANHKKSNVVFSNDCTNMNDFFNILELVAPYICVLKTHVDIICDFDNTFIERINHMKKQHNFLVIEDQKYSDIAVIVQKKYTNSIYKVKEWADIITIHGTVGDDSIKILAEQNINMLLIAQLSTSNNLITKDYTDKIIEIAKQNNVLGFIAQHKISTHKFLYFTPGVNIDNSYDHYGQVWSNPDALAKTGTQFFIIGRGISNAIDPIDKVKEYQTLCWNATQHNFIFST